MSLKNSTPASQQNSVMLLLLQLALLAVAIYYVCFNKLGETVINEYDEAVAIQVVQGMRESGKWWHPQTPTQALYSKPPFKMWLTYIPLHFWGESAFSYRFVDGAAGAVAVLILFFAARAMFASPLAGLVASFGMLGSKAYVEEHGVRMAVQDSMLTLLVTIAMLFAYRFIKDVLEEGNLKRARSSAQIFGLFTSFAILTKSAVGVLPLLLFGAYLLASRDLKKLWQADRASLFWIAGLALFLPALFYIPHFLFTEGAFSRVVEHELVSRAVQGFHHRDSVWYYFSFIVQKNAYVPKVLLLCAILYALWQYQRSKSRLYLFLLIWAVLPVLLFTIPRSRLYWYIVPALPGMALLVAGMLGAIFDRFCHALAAIRTPRDLLTAAMSGAFLCYGGFALGQHYFTVLERIDAQLRRTGLDLFTEEYLQKERAGVAVGPVLYYNRPKLSFTELTYQSMLSHGKPDITSKEERLSAFLETKPNGVIISDIPTFLSLLDRKMVYQYKLLRPERAGREQWLAIASYSPTIKFASLDDAEHHILFGKDDVQSLYGLKGPMAKHWEKVHSTSGPATGFLVDANNIHELYGAWVNLNAMLEKGEKYKDAALVIKINGQEVGSLQFSDDAYTDKEVFVQAKYWLSGKNTVSLHTVISGKVVAKGDQVLYLQRLSVSIAQPKRISPFGGEK